MICPDCKTECLRFGRHRNKLQRFRCKLCGKTYTEPHSRLEGRYLEPDKILSVLKLLVEGCSIRTTERVTGVHHTTILSLLAQVGEKCERLMEQKLTDLDVKDVQADEIWGFVRKKEASKGPEEAHDTTIGDAYTFVAIERHSKLVIAWHLGRRTSRDTLAFTEKVREATGSRFQITTDGFAPYRDAVSYSLGMRVDFAQLIKVYRAIPEGERRYSPAEVISTETVPVLGRIGSGAWQVLVVDPDPERICTSHVERQNLTMRMMIRRLTRLTNAFSKKWENLKAALALYFAYYNFCRVHRTIRVTPAMEAGIADRVWAISELLEVA